MRKLRPIIILIVIFGLILTTFTSGLAAAKDSINVAVGSPPQTMNPHGSDSDANLGIMANMFEGLLYRDGTWFPD